MRYLIMVALASMALATPAKAAGWEWFVKHTRSGPHCSGSPTTYYGEGRRNADGSRFDRHGMSAASWDYPFGTVLSVTNCWNGRTVMVTIKDRGPGTHQRRLGIKLDLSYGAAKQLALASSERNTARGRLESGWTSWSVVSMGSGETYHPRGERLKRGRRGAPVIVAQIEGKGWLDH